MKRRLVDRIRTRDSKVAVVELYWDKILKELELIYKQNNDKRIISFLNKVKQIKPDVKKHML